MTTLAGAGFCPAGLAIAGFGTVPAEPPVNGPLFVDPLGVQQTGRRIDPITKQYVYNPVTGHAIGMSAAAQAMLLVCTTDLGSSAVVDLGNELKSIKDITPNFVSRVIATYTNACQSIVDQKLVSLGAITVDQQTVNNQVRVFVTIKFVDLTTGLPDQVTF